jgi:hypothetical protein
MASNRWAVDAETPRRSAASVTCSGPSCCRSWARCSAWSTDSIAYVQLPGGNGVYEIPLGALTSIDTPNLFAAGRTADGDQYAGASLRVMGTAFATGQACGVAAAQHANYEQAAVAEVQSALRTQGALIDGDELPDPVDLINT